MVWETWGTLQLACPGLLVTDRFMDKVAEIAGRHLRLARELAEALEECGLLAQAQMARTIEREQMEIVEDVLDFTPVSGTRATDKHKIPD